MTRSLVSFYELGMLFPRMLYTTIVLLALDAVFSSISVVGIAPLADLLLERPEHEWLGVTHACRTLFQSLGLPFDLITIGSAVWFSLLLMAVFSVMIRVMTMRMRFAVIRHLLMETYDKVYDASWLFFSRIQRGDLVNTFLREIYQVGTAFQTFAASVANVVRIVAFVAVPLYVAPLLVLMCLAASLVLLLPFLWLGHWSYRFGGDNVAAANRYTMLVRESLEAAKEIIGLGEKEQVQRHVDIAFARYAKSTINAETTRFFSSQIYEPVGFLVLLVTLPFAREQGFSISVIAVVLWGLLRTIPPLKQTIYLKHQLDAALPSLEQVRAQQAQAQQYRQVPGTVEFRKLSDAIDVAGVSFSYPGQQPALDDISLRIRQGEVVAFVGESGSGKSTLADLIIGLQHPDRGQIAVDGQALHNYQAASWRKTLGLVPQKPVLFDLSIRDNLLWANPDASEADLWRACRLANAEDFIRQLPTGLDTEVGDAGVRLSGGQTQRIAIARALVRRPQILLLDEATSSLDGHNEAAVYRSVFALRGDVTIIVVAHRLASLASVDRVFVFGGGKLLEQGSYTELVRRNGIFHKLLALQNEVAPV